MTNGSHWVVATPGSLAAWHAAECRHDRRVDLNNSARRHRQCQDCGMTVTVLRVYGPPPAEPLKDEDLSL